MGVEAARAAFCPMCERKGTACKPASHYAYAITEAALLPDGVLARRAETGELTDMDLQWVTIYRRMRDGG